MIINEIKSVGQFRNLALTLKNETRDAYLDNFDNSFFNNFYLPEIEKEESLEGSFKAFAQNPVPTPTLRTLQWCDD